MDEITQGESKMINLMDEINKTVDAQKATHALLNSVSMKRKKLEKVKDEAEGICLDTIFHKIYKDALPVSDDHKVIHGVELDTEMDDFIKYKEPKGLQYYVREAKRKGNTAAGVLLESVHRLVKDYFYEVGMNINAYDSDDIKFEPDSEVVRDGIQRITDKMNTEDIAEVIRNNVKQAAIEDITKRKEQAEDMKDLVDDIKNDPSIVSEKALDMKLGLANIRQKKIFQPSLFEGIMINKTNLMKEAAPDMDSSYIGKKAFTESVKEMTKILVMEAFDVEPMPLREKLDMADKYARMLIPSSVNVTESAEEYYDDTVSLVQEGANLEIRRIFKAHIKEIKANVKSTRKLIKAKDYYSASKKIGETKEIIDLINKKIDELDAGKASSMILGKLAGDIPVLGRTLVRLFVPIVGSFDGINTIIKRLIARTNDSIKRGRGDMEDFNAYRNAIKLRLNEYSDALRRAEVIIKEGENRTEKPTESSEVKKKKETNKSVKK